jgi:hypothetical protein
MAPRRTTRGHARPRKAKQRPQRTRLLLRWCLLGVALFVGFLYYQPLSSYFETRAALNERTAEVTVLRQERARLAKRLEESTTLDALSREARRMNLVRPGEHLFIVKGVKEWRRAEAKRKQQATLEDDG